MPANGQTIAYVGEVPWHGLGKPVSFTVRAAEMIRAAGLDWRVEMRPARGYEPIKRKGKPDIGSPEIQMITLPCLINREHCIVMMNEVPNSANVISQFL